MEYTAIIILEYNNETDTVNCIESVERFNTAPVKYIVVDNGSPDATVPGRIEEYLRSKFSDTAVYGDADVPTVPAELSRATFLRSGSNDGYASGNNKGLRLAYLDPSVRHVMILNSDILFVADIIPPMLAELDSISDAAFISPVLYTRDMEGIDYNCARRAISLGQLMTVSACLHIDVLGIHRRRRIPLDTAVPVVPIELPSGSCMLCRKDMFESIGSFDPGTFLYYEENILWEKVRRKGLRNYIDTRLRCIHLGATSTRRQPSAFIAETNGRSIVYFAARYLGASGFQLWFLRVTSRLNVWKIRAIKALRR